MTSLIEQAAQRLEQLRRAGVEIPGDPPPRVTRPQPAMDFTAPDVAEAMEPPAVSKSVELDLQTLATRGFVTPNAPRSRTADQFRVIKRPLLSNLKGKGASRTSHGNLIMVTSALAGEGKSYTSINLAMSIAAELDHTVMLVDADVARPSIPGTLGLTPGPGLLDVLQGEEELANVLLRTNLPKLTLLTSGTPHPKATELLASDAMRRLLDDMSTRYADRIVVFDSPPLLLTTEARVLATHMGQIVMVVQADRTLQADVRQALSTIENCPNRFMVLNKARVDTEAKYAYGYGYGYGYGHDKKGHGHDKTQPQST
jgi:exopolysaccharide/PEP-CTERM locus tyrosine autokinase